MSSALMPRAKNFIYEAPKFYEQLELKAGILFAQETFGTDQLIVGIGQTSHNKISGTNAPF
jgi:hypothetical protein